MAAANNHADVAVTLLEAGAVSRLALEHATAHGCDCTNGSTFAVVSGCGYKKC